MSQTTTILFIHGNSTSSYIFKGVIQIVEQKLPNIRTYAIDLPGFGNADAIANDESYTLDMAITYVINVINTNPAFKDTDLILCGNSLGGHIAISLLDRKAEIVPKIVGLSIDGTPPIRHDDRYGAPFVPKDDGIRASLSLLAKNEQFIDEEAKMFVDCQLDDDYKGSREELYQLAKNAKPYARNIVNGIFAKDEVGIIIKNHKMVPISIAVASRDRAANLSYICPLAEYMYDRQIHVIHGTHLLAFSDPVLFSEYLMDFVRRVV